MQLTVTVELPKSGLAVGDKVELLPSGTFRDWNAGRFTVQTADGRILLVPCCHFGDGLECKYAITEIVGGMR